GATTREVAVAEQQERRRVSPTCTRPRPAWLIRHPADGGPRSAERPNRRRVLQSGQGVPGRLVGNPYRPPGEASAWLPRTPPDPTNQVNCPVGAENPDIASDQRDRR